jgi:hypothetical protein
VAAKISEGGRQQQQQECDGADAAPHQQHMLHCAASTLRRGGLLLAAEATLLPVNRAVAAAAALLTCCASAQEHIPECFCTANSPQAPRGLLSPGPVKRGAPSGTGVSGPAGAILCCERLLLPSATRDAVLPGSGCAMERESAAVLVLAVDWSERPLRGWRHVLHIYRVKANNFYNIEKA